MTGQTTRKNIQLTSSVMMTSSSNITSEGLPKDQYNMYQSMYNTPKRPSGFFMVFKSKVETFFVYVWVLVQTLFLIAGLTVLHFSTFSVMMVYLVNGVIRKRRELLPHKHFDSN